MPYENFNTPPAVKPKDDSDAAFKALMEQAKKEGVDRPLESGESEGGHFESVTSLISELTKAYETSGHFTDSEDENARAAILMLQELQTEEGQRGLVTKQQEIQKLLVKLMDIRRKANENS